jgi:hypothetical protein
VVGLAIKMMTAQIDTRAVTTTRNRKMTASMSSAMIVIAVMTTG